MPPLDQQHWPLRRSSDRPRDWKDGVPLAMPVDSGRLVIRSGNENDVAVCARGICRADIPWLGYWQLRDKSGEMTEFFADGIRQGLLRHRRMFVVSEKSETVAGAVAATWFAPGVVEIFWAMFAGYESDGYAEETVRALIAGCFKLGDVNEVRVCINPLPGETTDPMVDIAAAAGMVRQPGAVVAKPGEYKRQVWIYAVGRDDYFSTPLHS